MATRVDFAGELWQIAARMSNQLTADAVDRLQKEIGDSDGSHLSICRATAKLTNTESFDRATVIEATWLWLPEAERKARSKEEFIGEAERAIDSLPPKDTSIRGTNEASGRVVWPAYNPELTKQVVAETGCTMADLIELSPTGDLPKHEVTDMKARVNSMRHVLSKLFPGDPLLHLATSQDASRAMRIPANFGLYLQWLGSVQFTVPSPATAAAAKNKAGRESSRCLNNTGERRFIVIESDKVDLDGQAAILKHLSQFLPLAMVVDSRGKSLHGWFYCAHHTTPDQQAGAEAVFASRVGRFMRYACKLGADPALYVRCQLVRAPFGFRPAEPAKAAKAEHYAHDRIQHVIYLADMNR